MRSPIARDQHVVRGAFEHFESIAEAIAARQFCSDTKADGRRSISLLCPLSARQLQELLAP